jgi:non-heme chloroperoxidase
MATITVGTENSTDIELYYEDHGTGEPVETFFANFFNPDENVGSRLSEAALRANWTTAIGSAPASAYAVVPTWVTDFRADVDKIDVAALRGQVPRDLGQDRVPRNVIAGVRWPVVDGCVAPPMHD